ncbi:MAG: sulfatase-like hydrolase/transferase [Kiritimatiellae bacterium]|nr:sulfatase-like hydrolase/transferase [Kiritimatiellia bacterium]MDD5521756.1 sulfatase-like hydrolase/transferase [Kiritimatiellia bacterium]
MKQHRISRRNFIKIGAGSLCALTLGKNIATGQTRKQPNVLIITTDQQRVDVISALGNKWLKTPNMDSIAANGVYFRKSYCAFPLCSPSRASLHTGRPPHEIKVDCNSVPVDPAVTISGQVFKAAGYDTGYSGKWHLPGGYPTGEEGIAGFELLNKTERKGKLARDVDETTMNQAIEFLKRKHDNPFYLVVSFINPHDICLLANENTPILDDVRKQYMPADGVEIPPMPENFECPKGMPDTKLKDHDWDENKWRRYCYAYYRMVEDVDRQVGQVLKALRTAGQEDNTLIVFTSDHGEGLARHHWTGKMMYFDDEAAVPLIISWKGVTPAGRIDNDHLTTTTDVLPTICDYAGLKPPEKMRGESLRTVIEKPDTAGREYVVSEMCRNGKRNFMVRTKQYKYMSFPDNTPSEMFFNLDADPGEMKNLAGEDALAGEIERHRKLLAKWREDTEESKYQPVSASVKKSARRKNKSKLKKK